MKRSDFNRVIVAIAMMLIGWLPSLAHDFEVDGIYYDKINSSTVEVTKLHAVINYAADLDISNNRSDDKYTFVRMPDYPAVDDLEATAEGNQVELNWSEPEPVSAEDGINLTDDIEDYESFIIENIGKWTLYDGNGTMTYGINNVLYPHINEPAAFQVFNPSEIGLSAEYWDAHSGDQMLVSWAVGPLSAENPTVPVTDHWLISPLLPGNAQTISFFVKSPTDTYGLETFSVYYSTTGVAKENFIKLNTSLTSAPLEWTEVTVDLPQDAKYFAIVHNSCDTYALLVDDITYTSVAEEASANFLSGKTVNTYSGASERVSVEMTNEQAITAFQCDIYLPDGISIATIDGEYDINLSSRAKSSHSLSCVEQSDGSIRLLCYSMSLATFSGNEGELFDINFNISKDIEGNYQVLINNVVLTDKAQNEYKSSTTIDFNVKAYVPADVNNDGSINVTDVVATASYILGLDTKKFIFEAADMNKDGVINVTDIVGIASIILNGGSASSVSVQRCAPNSSDAIKIEDFVAGKNQSQQVAIEMTNASDYSACQMDIRLPKGMSIAECELSSVATDHMVAYRELPDGAVRVLVYSLTCRTLPDSEEGIISLRTTTDNRFEGGEIVVENILFADRGQNEYRLYDSVANVNLATGVSATDMDCVVYAENRSIVIISPCDQQATITSVDGVSRTYTLNEGRNKIAAPQAGVYIVTLADKTFKVIVK